MNSNNLYLRPVDMTAEKISPFAVFHGEEIYAYANPTAGYPMCLTDVDQLILLLTNKCLLMTTSLLEAALAKEMMITQKEIQNRVRQLQRSHYLEKFEFRCESGKSAGKVYSLGYRGAGFLRAARVKVNLTQYVSTLNAVQTKKILATVQYVIRSGADLEQTSICRPCFVPPVLENEKTSDIFRPQAWIQSADGSIFVEAVRRNDDAEDELLDKLWRMEKVLTSASTNIPVTSPSLLLICEDERHMHTIMECVKTYAVCSFAIRYTYDTAVYTDSSRLYTASDALRKNFA